MPPKGYGARYPYSGCPQYKLYRRASADWIDVRDETVIAASVIIAIVDLDTAHSSSWNAGISGDCCITWTSRKSATLIWIKKFSRRRFALIGLFKTLILETTISARLQVRFGSLKDIAAQLGALYLIQINVPMTSRGFDLVVDRRREPQGAAAT